MITTINVKLASLQPSQFKNHRHNQTYTMPSPPATSERVLPDIARADYTAPTSQLCPQNKQVANSIPEQADEGRPALHQGQNSSTQEPNPVGLYSRVADHCLKPALKLIWVDELMWTPGSLPDGEGSGTSYMQPRRYFLS